jgi:hypothetical protein
MAALTANVEVAELNANGSIRLDGELLTTLRYAALEIGCSDRDTMDGQWLPRHPDAFLLSFEPLLDKYAVLLSRGTRRAHGDLKDKSTPLGHHAARAVVLPLAISPHGGPVAFRVHRTAGCSSMLPVNRAATWAPWCSKQVAVRKVPSITLSAAIALVPAHLPIALIKIDTQGMDLALVRSCDPALLRSRVLAMTIEVRSPACTALYETQEDCHAAVAYMRSLAFHNTTACPGEQGRGDGRRGSKSGACETALTFRSHAPGATKLAHAIEVLPNRTSSKRLRQRRKGGGVMAGAGWWRRRMRK